MIVDGGCPSTLSGKDILDRYLRENNIQYKDLPVRNVNMVFKFGDTKLTSSTVVDVPIKVKVIDCFGNVGVHYTEVPTYRVEGKVPYLLGLNTMEAWKAKLDMGDKKGLEISIDNGLKNVKILTPKDKTHMKMALQPLKEKTLGQSVMYLQKELVNKECELVLHVDSEDLQSYLAAETINHDFLTKFHKGSGHKSEKNMMHSLSQANVVTPETRKVVKNVVSSCQECKLFGRSFPKPKTTLPKVCDTNQIITWDLKEWGQKYIMWMIDSFSRFAKGVVISNKKKETILKVLYYEWCCQLGYPTQGFWSDNGGEFRNSTMVEFVEKCQLTLRFGPSNSPWSNGLNERNHGVCDVIIKKAMQTDKTLTLQEAVNIAAWSHNTNVNKLGYSPMQLQLGKAVTLPGFTEGSIVTDSKFENELVEKLILNAKNAIKNFNIENFKQKITEAAATRVPRYRGRKYQNGEEVYIQREDLKRWSGPVRVVFHDSPNVWVMFNGNLIKLAECKVQPVYDQTDLDPGFKQSNVVSFKTDDNCAANSAVNFKKADIEKSGVQTRSKSKREIEVNNYYTEHLNNSCIDALVENVMTVEIPVKDHGRIDCVEAKKAEIQNLLNFETFEEVADTGQKTIQSRWVLTQKQAHDGQKKKVKGRLVAKGFQEQFKPQSDSPTVLRDSFKTALSVAANEGHHIASVDITGAFLQGEKLDRDVFVKPPPDVLKEKPGFIWKLNKCLYGLNDASRNFYYRVRPLLEKRGFKIAGEDEAYFYKNVGGNLQGQVAIHVDDFLITGSNEFIEDTLSFISSKLKVSKVERGKFRFTGIDIEKKMEGIQISMEDYVKSIEIIPIFREDLDSSALTATEVKLYRKYVGKFLWLAENVRPDLSFLALDMSRKVQNATLKDLKAVNRNIITHVYGRENKVVLRPVGKREDLVVRSVSDAAFYMDSPSILGEIIMLANNKDDRVSPLFWKSKQVTRVCKSSKDAETRAGGKCVEDSVYLAQRIEEILFGSSQKRIKVEMHVDSEPLIESIRSTKRVENKALCKEIGAMKESLLYEDVTSFSYIQSKQNPADKLTKAALESPIFYNIFLNGIFSNETSRKIVKLVKREHTNEIRLFQDGSCQED